MPTASPAPASAVAEDPQAVVDEDLVALALGVEGQRVLEAGAAAAAHADPQARALERAPLAGQELLDLLGALVGEGDQRLAPVPSESNASRRIAPANLSPRMPSSEEIGRASCRERV